MLKYKNCTQDSMAAPCGNVSMHAKTVVGAAWWFTSYATDGNVAGIPWGCLSDVHCMYTHRCVCVHVRPDYAGIIVGRWEKQSLKVRVVWLISSSLYDFN